MLHQSNVGSHACMALTGPLMHYIFLKNPQAHGIVSLPSLYQWWKCVVHISPLGSIHWRSEIDGYSGICLLNANSYSVLSTAPLKNDWMLLNPEFLANRWGSGDAWPIYQALMAKLNFKVCTEYDLRKIFWFRVQDIQHLYTNSKN